MKTKTGSMSPAISSQGKSGDKKPSKAEWCITTIKTGSSGDRMNAANRYWKGELYRVQGYDTLEEAVEAEDLDLKYSSFLRLANAAEFYKKITGEECPPTCVETALRPLTSLSEEELDKVAAYVESKEISLADKSPAQVRMIILSSLAKSFSKDEEFNDVMDDLVEIVTEKMAEAKLTSTTAINMVASAIAKKVDNKVRESLTQKPTKAKKAAQNS